MIEKILFIIEPFYEYPKKIKEALERNFGCSVDMLEVMNDDITNPYLRKVNSSIRGRKETGKEIENENYSMQALFFETASKTQYDYIFALISASLNLEAFRRFVLEQKKAKKVLYLWDDIKRVENYDSMRTLFDRIVTFDKKDSIEYNVDFLPLFYTDDYRYVSENKEYDICLVGALHSDREFILKELLKQFPTKDYKWKAILITKHRGIFRQKIHRKRPWKTPFYIKYKSISPMETSKILKGSRVCVDIAAPSQSGLTIRTIEALAAKTKVITTNESVKQYDFYNENNIFVIDRKNPLVTEEFVRTKYEPIEKNIYESYSIDSWVRNIII